MCEFMAKCKNDPEYRIVHKRHGARSEYARNACQPCASRIGFKAPGGPLIEQPNRENPAYRIEAL